MVKAIKVVSSKDYSSLYITETEHGLTYKFEEHGKNSYLVIEDILPGLGNKKILAILHNYSITKIEYA